MEIPASEDLENAPGILLNPHVDTVSACSPQWLEFDKEKGDFYHRYNGSIGADDKSGVTMVVEALRALKLNYWDRDYPHRRILAIFTAQEERGLLGAKYLAAHHREIFADLDICLSVDGYLEHGDRPYVHLVRKNRMNTFKAKQIGAIIEKCAKERHKPFRTYIASEGTFDAAEFPPEAYKVACVMTPSYGMHAKERVNARELIDYIDMLVNLVVQLDVNYLEAIGDRKGLDRLTETYLEP